MIRPDPKFNKGDIARFEVDNTPVYSIFRVTSVDWNESLREWILTGTGVDDSFTAREPFCRPATVDDLTKAIKTLHKTIFKLEKDCARLSEWRGILIEGVLLGTTKASV